MRNDRAITEERKNKADSQWFTLKSGRNKGHPRNQRRGRRKEQDRGGQKCSEVHSRENRWLQGRPQNTEIRTGSQEEKGRLRDGDK